MKKILLVVLVSIISISTVVTFSLAGCKPSEEEEEEIFLGLAAHAVRNSWEDLYVKAFNWYCEEKGITSTWTEAGYDASIQITQAKRLIDMGIDGLIISPWNIEALTSVMEYAEEKGVPVICTNTTVNSSYPLMFVGYGAKRGGTQLGEEIVEYLEETYGEAKGTVLELSAGLGTSEDIMRGGGFHEVVDQYEGIKVITEIGAADQEQSKTRTLAVLQSGEKIDAVFAQNGSMALGASAALQAYEGTDPSEVYIATVDAFPAITDEIASGYIDIAVDQTPAFYNPIAIHYLLEYIEKGESALPKVGDTITADDLQFSSGNEYLGIDPWAEPMWAPAEIQHMTDYSEEITEDYLWFQTNAVVVTEENCDSKLLWGNFPIPGW